MRYCVLYPQTENVHLIKDVGMIAYKLHKLFNYDSFIASYDNGKYPYLQNEVNGLKMDFINKTFNNDVLDGMNYLRKNSKKIDVLQIFHVTVRSVFYAFTYKHYNKDGKIFLKLDCTKDLINEIKSLKGLKLKLFTRYFNTVDIIGVEQVELYNELKLILVKVQDKFTLIPNGIDFSSSSLYNQKSFKKKNVILTVSRIGSLEKGSDILLNAFLKLDKKLKSNWLLVLVGPIEKEFKPFFDDLSSKNPELINQVLIMGPVYDRQKLFEIYSEAKIFCMSSRFESFAIAVLEAASFGDIIVSTDVGISSEIVGVGNGSISQVDDINGLAKGLECIMKKSDQELGVLSQNTADICRKKFDWDKIVTVLYERIER